MGRGLQGERLAAAAVIIVTAVMLAAFVSAGGSPGSRASLVLTTFPGIDGDIRLLLDGCSSVVVRAIVPPGVDPHEYTLRPDDIEAARRAVLVVSTGHAPFEEELARYVPDKVMVIPSLEGIRLMRLPTGALNLHMPIYDPDNYRVFIEQAAQRLSEAIPECSSTIEANLERILASLAEAERYRGSLAGAPAVAAAPVAQYAVSWLGADIRVYFVAGHGAQTSPETVVRARELLGNGGMAVIIVDSRGMPANQPSEELLRLAGETGAPVIKVEAPYTPKPLLYKILNVAGQAVQHQGGG